METIERILKIIISVYGIMASYHIIYTILGVLFPSKKFKASEKQYNYAVLIACWNEENVIAQLIDSLKKQDYPQEKITIFVCADRCTDNTAEVARSAGAIVYERIDPLQKKRSKGFAIDFLLQNIKKDYPEKGIETFDGYFMFDADNLIATSYVTEMNKAFNNKKYDYVDSYINSKNCGTSFVSTYSALSDMGSNLYSCKPRSILGLSSLARGRGILYRSHMLVDGWKWCSIGIDFNSSAEFISKGYRSTYCGAAEMFDENATSFKIYFRQRKRWARTRFNVFCKYSMLMLFGIILPKDWHKTKTESYEKPKFSLLAEVQKRLSCYDMFVRVFPLFLLTFIVTILYPVGRIIYGLCVPGSFSLSAMANIILVYYGALYISELIPCILTIVREHRRLRVNPYRLLRYVLFWPLVTILLQYLSIWAVISPVKWKKIPHTVGKTIEEMNAEKTIADHIYEKTTESAVETAENTEIKNDSNYDALEA